MRVLLVHPGPHYSVADVAHGWRNGLAQAGVSVQTDNLNDRLDFYTAAHVSKDGEMVRSFDLDTAMRLASSRIKVAAFDWWPDVVIVVSCLFVPPDIIEALRGRGMHVVLLCTESPYEDERQIVQAAAFDTVVVNDPANLDAFREVNKRTIYIGHAFDPAIHYVGDDERDGVVFVGTGFQSRMDLFEAVDWSGLDLTLGGFWSTLDESSPLRKYLLDGDDRCVDNKTTADLYRTARAGLNLYRREHHDNDSADGLAVGPREVEMAACGLPFVRDRRDESDELFPFLPTFDTAEELGCQLRWLTADAGRAADLGRGARAAVASRTFARNAARLLRFVNA